MSNMQNGGIPYQEKDDGNFYPELDLPERAPLGRYGTLMRDYLRDYRPEDYRRMEEDGSLAGYLRQTDDRFRAQFERTLEQLEQREQTDRPDPADFPAAVQFHARLEQQAHELTMDDLFPNRDN